MPRWRSPSVSQRRVRKVGPERQTEVRVGFVSGEEPGRSSHPPAWRMLPDCQVVDRVQDMDKGAAASTFSTSPQDEPRFRGDEKWGTSKKRSLLRRLQPAHSNTGS